MIVPNAALRTGLLILLALALAGCSWFFGEDRVYSTPGHASQAESSVVHTARTQLGVRYHWGGESPRDGFDCSGLIYWVYAQHGIILPRPSWEQFKVGREVYGRDLRPGDLVFFRISSTSRSLHVGIMTGPGTFIHSPKAGGRVSESSLNNPFWKKHFVGGKRVL